MLSKKNKKTSSFFRRRRDVAESFSLLDKIPAAMNYVPEGQIYKFSSSFEALNIIVTSISVPTYTGSTFTAASINDFTSLAAVFDQYRITEIEVWIIPHTSNATANTAIPGLMSSVIDYDDATAPGSLAQLGDYSNCLTTSGLTGHYRRWRPRAAVALYSGAFTSYGNVESPWIDCSSSSVQHYGLKTGNSVTNGTYTYDLNVRFHMEFKNAR
jgi:hypothetical protein